MDKNLLQGIVMLGLYDRKSIPKKTLSEYLKSYFGDEPYPLNFLEFYELIGHTAQYDYNDGEIRAFCEQLISVAVEVFDLNFEQTDVDMILSSCSARQSAHRSVNIFAKYPDVCNRLIEDAKKLDMYASRDDDGLFYIAYKLNSYLLRSTFQVFPGKRELTYELVNRLNNHQNRYEKIQFVGKDKDNV